jgi:hypothetical protein
MMAEKTKSTGPEDMNVEFIRKVFLPYLLKFLEFLNTCWKTGFIPDEWKEAVLSSLFKKGNRIEHSNYRGLCLLNSSYKVYAKVLWNRVNNIAESILKEEQNAFRKGCFCIDCVFTISQLIEKEKRI